MTGSPPTRLITACRAPRRGFAGERAGKREVQPISELTRLYEYLQLARSCITCIPNQTLQRTASRKTGFIPSEWPGGGAAAPRRVAYAGHHAGAQQAGGRTDGRTDAAEARRRRASMPPPRHPKRRALHHGRDEGRRTSQLWVREDGVL